MCLLCQRGPGERVYLIRHTTGVTKIRWQNYSRFIERNEQARIPMKFLTKR